MKMYTTLMTAYGVSAGIDYKFGGTVANTFQAHRVIQYFQETKGPEVADKLVSSLYRQYFGLFLLEYHSFYYPANHFIYFSKNNS